MATIKRVSIKGTRIKVSRPGFDVDDVPDNSPKYLAMDSEWDRVARLVDVVRISNTTLQAPRTVNFDEQDDYPFVFFSTIRQGQNIVLDDDFWYRDIPAGIYYASQTHVVEYITKRTARLSATTGFNNTNFPSQNQTKRDFILMVLKPWPL